MTTEELNEILKAVAAGRPQVTQTLNFHAPIGQQVAHVDKIEAHFDKEMGMQLPEDPAAQADEPNPQPEPQEETERLHFIHPALDDVKAAQVHHEVARLCRSFGIQEICAHLSRLAAEGRLLLPQNVTVAYNELTRMGMPTHRSGFDYKTFAKYYRK